MGKVIENERSLRPGAENSRSPKPALEAKIAAYEQLPRSRWHDVTCHDHDGTMARVTITMTPKGIRAMTTKARLVQKTRDTDAARALVAQLGLSSAFARITRRRHVVSAVGATTHAG